MTSIFSGEAFDQATENGGGVWFLPGLYPRLTIDELKIVRSTNPKTLGQAMFVASLDILESNVPDRPKGSKASWVVNLSKSPKMTMGDVKKFFALLLKCAFAEVVGDVCDAAVGPAQPFKGTEVSLVAMLNNKGTYTRHDWTLIAQGERLVQLLAA